jgi:hypothetical protein
MADTPESPTHERDEDRELVERMEQWIESFYTHLGNDGWEWHPASGTPRSLRMEGLGG